MRHIDFARRYAVRRAVIALVPLTISEARAWAWPSGKSKHRHHSGPRAGDRFAVGLEHDGDLVAVALAGNPCGPGLGRRCIEVTRLVNTAPVADNACSRLYSAIARMWLAAGGDRLVTYIRADEPGTSLRAANWWPTARVTAEDWQRRAGHAQRGWLPGLYEPATDAVDRVRWEYGPGAVAEMGELRALGRRKET